MSFPVEIYRRQVDSWDERCPYEVVTFRDEARGGWDRTRSVAGTRGVDDNKQLFADGRWIAENLKGLWSSYCTGTTNCFRFQHETEAAMFRLFRG